MYQVLKTVQFITLVGPLTKVIVKTVNAKGLVLAHESARDLLLQERNPPRPLSKSQPSASYSEKNLRSHRQSQNAAVSKTLTNLHLYKNIGFESFSRLFLALQPSKSYDLLNTLSKHKTHVFFSKATYSEPKTVLQSVHKGKFDGKCIE